MKIHLFSTPGRESEHDIGYILDASREYLEGKDDPLVAYLPAASLGDTYQAFTEKSFSGMAKVVTINPEVMTLPEMETVIRQAALLYIPGGNTFLLNHRLQLSNVKEYLRKKVKAGLPLVAFSAGTVLCGPDILTSNDMNSVETTYLNGLNLLPFNFNPHYPADEIERLRKDDWLSEYHVFHENPIVMLADGAGIQVDGKKIHLSQGEAWILRKNQEKERLNTGEQISI